MKAWIITLSVLGLIVFGINSCEQSEWNQQQKRERAERERREQTPHVIREADGCKVYAFKSGDRYHYFTRCPDSRTTTESSWEECRQSGKQRTCETKTESIEVAK